MRVLVTGGTGFLGGHIVARCLDRGYEVRVLSRRQPACNKVQHIRGDLTDLSCVLEAVEGCDAVFHVAAKAGIWGPYADYYAANVVGTKNITNACKNCDVNILIHTSTPSVVFNATSIVNGNETLPYGDNWLCAYAQTKAVAEQYALAAHAPNKLHVIALRPHLIYGRNDPHLLPRIIAKARTGQLRQVGNGRNRVSITHVDNAADAHMLALDAAANGAGGRPYFITDAEPVVLWEWIRALLQTLRLPQPRLSIPYKLAYAIGAAGEFFKSPHGPEPRLTRFLAVELAKDHTFNIAAAHRDLAYVPKTYTIEDVAASLESTF